MKYLAWCPDDTDIDGARSYSSRWESDHPSIAWEHAGYEWNNSAGECGHEFAVSVVSVDDDGTRGDVQTFDVVVEYEPTFTATLRTEAAK